MPDTEVSTNTTNTTTEVTAVAQEVQAAQEGVDYMISILPEFVVEVQAAQDAQDAEINAGRAVLEVGFDNSAIVPAGCNLVKNMLPVQFPPTNAVHVATFQQKINDNTRFEWRDGTTHEQRMAFTYEHGLDRIAKHANRTNIYMPAAAVYPVLEYVRAGMKAIAVFLVKGPTAGIADIYMIQNEPAILLGVNGEIGCGKSTVVEYLESKHGFREYMFAMPLKQMAVSAGFEPHQVFGTQEQKLEINEFWGISGREFLQVFGSEVCRDQLPRALPKMKFNGLTLWVRLFEKFLATQLSKNIAVSDVRFADESQTIKKHNGLVVRIVRPGVQNNQPVAVQKHVSETQATMIAPNVILTNNGTLEILYKKLDLLVDLIRRGFITSNTRELNL